jgi:YfiH family protein
MSVPHLSAEALAPLPHGFFGREGGNSTGAFATNNMSVSVGDDRDVVRRNRAAACRVLGLDDRRLVLLKQVHSNRIVTLTTAEDAAQAPEADGLVTSDRSLALGIMTADCAPVLLADHEAGVIGALHAGWKGALSDICEAAVAAMVGLGAERRNMRAMIGPTISAANYEVGPQFAASAIESHPGAATRIFRPAGGREHFDLPGFLADRLREAGIGVLADCRMCTYAHPHAYFSHRRATHEGQITGRQIALIGLA